MSSTNKDCLDPDNKNKCCFFKIANAFLLSANMLLLIVGFYCLPSKNDNSYFSVIVAVLAILVTMLITWQIWQTIDAKNTVARMEASVRDAEKRDIQLQHLLEAFQMDEIAKAQLTLGERYAQSVLALRSFIRSGVSSSYIPISNIFERLEGILKDVEDSTDEKQKERFSKVNRECDNYYTEIMTALQEQINLFTTLHTKIEEINKRRTAITKPKANS